MNKLSILLLLYLFNKSACASAQLIRHLSPAGYPGTGAYSIGHADVFSFTANQAALAQLKTFSAGVFAERKYLLSELNQVNFAAAIPATSGNVGLRGAYAGSSDYSETMLGLAYARKLGSKADLGVQFNYYNISIAGYGKDGTVGFEVGSIFHLTPKLHAGLQVCNPLGGKFGRDQGEKLASAYSFALGYEASEKFLCTISVVKEEDRPVKINTNCQYRILSTMVGRMGISANAASIWWGVGFMFDAFRLDIVAAYHDRLGISPGIQLLFHFKNAKE